MTKIIKNPDIFPDARDEEEKISMLQDKLDDTIDKQVDLSKEIDTLEDEILYPKYSLDTAPEKVKRYIESDKEDLKKKITLYSELNKEISRLSYKLAELDFGDIDS